MTMMPAACRAADDHRPSIDGPSIVKPVSLLLLLTCVNYGLAPLAAQTLPPGVIDAPPTLIGEKQSIGSDTTLNLRDGGTIGHFFDAGFPDQVSEDLVVNIEGGNVGYNFTAHAGSKVNVRGGNLGASFTAGAGSDVEISGGAFGVGLTAAEDSRLTISGGNVGAFVDFRVGVDVSLIGGEFKLNGQPSTQQEVTIGIGDYFTGTLADGTPFIFRDIFRDIGRYSPYGFIDIVQGVRLTVADPPPIDITPILVDGSSERAPKGLRAGQSLTLREGGRLGDYFSIVEGEIRVEGGTAGLWMEVAAGKADLVGGVVGGVSAIAGSEVNLSDDAVVHGAELLSGSVMNIRGGYSSHTINVFHGSTVNLFTDGGDTPIQPLEGGTVNVYAGDFGSQYYPHEGSVTNIFGGRVVSFANGPEMYALNLLDGVVEDFFSFPYQTTIMGGEIGDWARAWTGSVTISAGSIGDGFTMTAGDVHISGGAIGDGIGVFISGAVNWSGGEIGHGLALNGESSLNLIGTEFQLDGAPVELIPGQPTPISDRGALLTGLLADGSPIALDLSSSDGSLYLGPDASLTLTLVSTPDPTACLMLVVAAIGCSSRRFRFHQAPIRACHLGVCPA